MKMFQIEEEEKREKEVIEIMKTFNNTIECKI